jgi:hypothetical protein
MQKSYTNTILFYFFSMQTQHTQITDKLTASNPPIEEAVVKTKVPNKICIQ